MIVDTRVTSGPYSFGTILVQNGKLQTLSLAMTFRWYFPPQKFNHLGINYFLGSGIQENFGPQATSLHLGLEF